MNSELFKKVRELADNLIATAEPNKYWDDVNELTQEECLVLDSIAFECSCCNQWWSVHERLEKNDAFVCQDCSE